MALFGVGGFGQQQTPGFGGTFGTVGGATLPYNTNQSYELPGTPNDGISSLSWSAQGSILASTSWDKSVKIWEVQQSPNAPFYNAIPRLSYNHDQPVLCCSFSKDTQHIFSGGCDGKLKMFNLATQQAQIIGQHDAPIKHVFWIDEMKMVVTGGWDKKLRFFNGQQPTPVAEYVLPERVYAMDMKYPVLVVGCADRHILIFNLSNMGNPITPVRQVQTNLKLQTRCVSIFPDRIGYAVGSIEGRVSIAHIDEANKDKNFGFKCHRIQQNANIQSPNDEIHAVNAIDFHQGFGTFVTTGTDGIYQFWDKDNKQKLKSSEKVNYPIPCAKFSSDGLTLAYAVSYDWYKGHQDAKPTNPNKILLHRVLEEHVKKKTTAQSRR